MDNWLKPKFEPEIKKKLKREPQTEDEYIKKSGN